MSTIEGEHTPIRRYKDIVESNPSLRTNTELGVALLDASSIIWVNDLFDVLPLENDIERQIFRLGLADRFLREKAYLIRSPKKAVNPIEILKKQKERIFSRSDDTQIKNIYEAFDVLRTERDLLTQSSDPRGLDRASAIWLAASQLFPAFQQSNPFGQRLERDFPISGDVLDKWVIGWKNRFVGIDQAYAVTE